MKKTKLLILSIFFAILANPVSSDGFYPVVYEFVNPEVTVSFSENLDISSERQINIAREIAGIPLVPLIDPNISSPDNIICTLFGHDLETTTVTATHHKVYPYSPRCLMEIYHVSYCKRCNYTNQELTNSFYIVCCPED